MSKPFSVIKSILHGVIAVGNINAWVRVAKLKKYPVLANALVVSLSASLYHTGDQQLDYVFCPVDFPDYMGNTCFVSIDIPILVAPPFSAGSMPCCDAAHCNGK